ncbi:MAG: serine/threonine-protein kinase [Polyangiales bacterium]
MQSARELTSFGKYRLIASLGSGGMAQVYLALTTGPAGFNKLLVLKVLRQDLGHLFGGNSDSIAMFWREARLLAQLNHPNIVQTHEVGEIDGHCFIAMEYLDGQPYSVALTRMRGSDVSLAEHLRIVSCVARALHYSHALRSYDGEAVGIVHRDVSPHNIILTYDGQVKLLDYGVATSLDPDHVTRVGVIKGKLDYIAPEQLRGDSIDGRADVFALGAVLWEALSGHRFAGGRRVADALKVQARLAGGERKLRALKPLLPDEVVRIVERAIALDPADRFEDAAAFANALDAYMVTCGERPRAQTLSAIMVPLFESERARMNEIINTQLQAVKSSSSSTELDGPGGLPQLQRKSDEGLISYVPDAPEDPALDEPTHDVHSGSRRVGVGRSWVASLSAPQRHLSAAVIAGMVVVGGALALLWPARDSAGPIVSQPLPAPAAVAHEPAPQVPESLPPRPAAPELALLVITVSPETARITVDGVAVSSPFSGKFRKDASMHLVEASADGFQPIKQFVQLEHDQTLALVLGRASASARRSSASAPRVEAPRAAFETAPPPKAVPVKPSALPGAEIEIAQPAAGGDDIDQTNPYRNKK